MEEGSLKRSSTLIYNDTDEDSDSFSAKKVKVMKEFPLNRQSSSNESQYIVLSQDDKVIDQTTLEYSLEDFLSDDDDATDNEDDEDNKETVKNDEKEKIKQVKEEDDTKLPDKTTVDLDATQLNSEGDSFPFNGMSDLMYPNTFNGETNANNGPSLGENSENITLKKIASLHNDAKVIVSIIPGVNYEIVYDKLKKIRPNPNRLDIVTTEMLDNPEQENDLSRDAAIIMWNVENISSKTINDSYVHSLLQLNKDKSNRVDIVTQQILVSIKEEEKNLSDNEPSKENNNFISDNNSKENKILLKKLNSDPDDPLVVNDPIFQDMKVVSKMFPEMDRNEIYAYLEAHHDKKNRIEIVIEELLQSNNESQNSDQNAPLTNRSRGEFENLCEIFPDCDPNYIFEKLEENASDNDRMNKLAAQMFENRDYPKLKDVLEKQNKVSTKRHLLNMDFNIHDFLKKFPDPIVTFEDNTRAMSSSYTEHVLVQIKNDYCQLKDGYIKEVLQKNNHNLTKSVREINAELTNIIARGNQSKKLRNVERMTELSFPEQPDEFFFHELLYIKHEQEIKDYLKLKEDEKQLKIDEARENRELFECGCCFDDEVLFEDMASCIDGHLFCKECIRRSTEATVGGAQYTFNCLSDSCKQEFSLSTLQPIISPKLFSTILQKLQEEELRKADIPDLVSCPYCSFATVMPDPNDKVFKCLNPECLKETCRFCQEPNHVPLRCNEVEKRADTNARTYIENKITEAMLRTCSNCKKKFFKDFGCNKMTCVCGTTMCYVCREPNIDYDHFNENGSCAQENDIEALHRREMEEAAEEARLKCLEENPELDLKYDPDI